MPACRKNYHISRHRVRVYGISRSACWQIANEINWLDRTREGKSFQSPEINGDWKLFFLIRQYMDSLSCLNPPKIAWHYLKRLCPNTREP